MLGKENQRDKKRFDHLKATQIQKGQTDEKATESAAEEVKQMREREGRSENDKQAQQD